MRPGWKGLAVIATLRLAQTAGAEPKDLAGRWTLVVENAGPRESAAPPRIPATAGSGWGREITITQEARRITIERHQFAENDMQPPMRYVYPLGEEESRNVVNMGRGPQEQIARAGYKGDTLVITSRHAAGTALAAEVTQVFSIDPSGELIVKTTRTAGGATATASARYRRSPPPASSRLGDPQRGEPNPGSAVFTAEPVHRRGGERDAGPDRRGALEVGGRALRVTASLRVANDRSSGGGCGRCWREGSWA